MRPDVRPLGDPNVNMFETVSSDGHQMSPTGAMAFGSLRSHVEGWDGNGGGYTVSSNTSLVMALWTLLRTE